MPVHVSKNRRDFFSAVVVVIPISLSAQSVQWGDTKLPASQVCPGSMAQYGCPPTADPRLALNQFQPTVPIANGSPAWGNFLGRVTQRNDKSGGNARVCGGAVSSPFRPSDFEVTVHNTLGYTRNLNRDGGTSAKANLLGVLQSAGVAGAILNRARATLNNNWSNVFSRTITSNGRFTTAVIRQEVMDSIDADTPAPRFAQCAAALRADRNLRLIRGVSVAHVQAGTNATDLRDSVVAGLEASLSGIVGSDKVAEVKPEFQRVIATEMAKTLAESYSILVETFYQPQPARR